MENKLLWLKEVGIGYYPVTETPYDQAYWEKYVGYEQTEIGITLNNCRKDIVSDYPAASLVDIGIGSGIFVREMECLGYDINPVAVQWLKDRGAWWDKTPVESMAFWDSLEHIHNPTEILSFVQKYVFISCPIYRDLNHILASKHFRPDEHCWYWTRQGLQIFMRSFDFELIEFNKMEQDCGREDIETFVFQRV